MRTNGRTEVRDAGTQNMDGGGGKGRCAVDLHHEHTHSHTLPPPPLTPRSRTSATRLFRGNTGAAGDRQGRKLLSSGGVDADHVAERLVGCTQLHAKSKPCDPRGQRGNGATPKASIGHHWFGSARAAGGREQANPSTGWVGEGERERGGGRGATHAPCVISPALGPRIWKPTTRIESALLHTSCCGPGRGNPRGKGREGGR